MKPSASLYTAPGMIGLIFIVISFLVNDQTVDIHIHDTYIIIANSHFIRGTGILVLFLWLVVVLTRKLAWLQWLSQIHILLSVLTLSFLASVPLWFRFIDLSVWTDFSHFNRLSRFISIVLWIFLFAQVIFVFNLIAGLIRKLIKPPKN